MRMIAALVAAAVASSPAAAREIVPYYGPKRGLMGEGYKHNVEKDGSLRVVTEYHTRDPMVAMNVALYRAAELAREAGKPYVEVLNGYAMASYGVANGFVYLRPSDTAAAPAACKAKRCYTADVAKVMQALGGRSGDQPGVPYPTVDELGRTVTISGFGIGAVAWTERKRR